MRQQWVHLAASAAAFAGLVHRAAGATIPEFTEEEYTPEEYEPSGLVEQLHSFTMPATKTLTRMSRSTTSRWG